MGFHGRLGASAEPQIAPRPKFANKEQNMYPQHFYGYGFLGRSVQEIDADIAIVQARIADIDGQISTINQQMDITQQTMAEVYNNPNYTPEEQAGAVAGLQATMQELIRQKDLLQKDRKGLQEILGHLQRERAQAVQTRPPTTTPPTTTPVGTTVGVDEETNILAWVGIGLLAAGAVVALWPKGRKRR